MELVVVGSPSCAPCKILKANLEEENIPFLYIDATKNEKFVEQHGITGTPTTMLFENNATDDYPMTTIIGYDDDKEEQIFELADLL